MRFERMSVFMESKLLVSNLEKNGFGVKCFETSEEACKYLCDNIVGKTIGIGGSQTVKEIGLEEKLAENNDVYWHWNKELVSKYGGAKTVRDLAQNADVYICSANAISQTGEIVNIDGTGNRIASTAYGHEKVYFVVGKNKIAEDLHKAMYRAKNVAAPKNAQRLNRNTPCAIKGDKCYDCKSPDRICNAYMILARPMTGMDMEVILIDENLGA